MGGPSGQPTTVRWTCSCSGTASSRWLPRPGPGATGFESGEALFDGSRVIFVSASRSARVVPGQVARPIRLRYQVEQHRSSRPHWTGSCVGRLQATLYRANDEGVLVGVTDAVSGIGTDADDLDGQIVLLPETGGYQVVSAAPQVARETVARRPSSMRASLISCSPRTPRILGPSTAGVDPLDHGLLRRDTGHRHRPRRRRGV